MCALLAPILKSGYNLFTPGVGSGHQAPVSKHQQHFPLPMAEPTSSALSRGHHHQHHKHVTFASDSQDLNANRLRTTSEQSPLVASGASSTSSPAVMNVGVRRPSAGPPPVDMYRRRSALSTSQYYLQQRRILAQQQQAKRQEMAQKQFLQQKVQKAEGEKMFHDKNDENRS